MNLRPLDPLFVAAATKYLYRRRWQKHEFVIWDHLATMHRARPFDDRTQTRGVYLGST